MDKLLYFFAIFPALRMETVNDRLILKLLRAEDYHSIDIVNDASKLRSSDSDFIKDLSRLKLKRSAMSDIWPKLLRNQYPQRMTPLDWKAYDPILHTLPPEILIQINVTNPTILEYFGSLTVLTPTQLAFFSDRLKREFGAGLLMNKRRILGMRNILCGFNEAFYDDLPSHIYRTLLDGEVFKTVSSCDSDTLRSMIKSGFKHRIFGPPGTWNSTFVTKLGYLIGGLDQSEIRHITDQSVKGITPEVIRSVPVHVLKNMRSEQLKALNVSTMSAWRRRTGDMTFTLSSASLISSAAILLTLSVIFA